MTHLLTVLPWGRTLSVPAGANLLRILRSAGLAPEAPCGGRGTCGKCTVLIDGTEVKACAVTVDRDLTVTVPQKQELRILTDGIAIHAADAADGFRLSFDVGTTTVAGALLDPRGNTLAVDSAPNPQAAYGADVVSRIRAALEGHMEALTAAIRNCLNNMALSLCTRGHLLPTDITQVTLVGNPAMQQLFLGILPENLSHPPFPPLLTNPETVDASAHLPCLKNADLLIIPDISGFVGADTLGCILATGMDTAEEITLLVDIGTNGELVLGNRHRLVSCATAAGPALEGACIQFGMTARPGAIDHVHIENGTMICHTIGGVDATGICGSGLIDAVACGLKLGLLNSRGKILTESGRIPLTDTVFLTQEDIRQVQLAKGAIAAGIRLLAEQMAISLDQIHRVYLAGAFGTYLDPESACRIGLLPPELANKIEAVGNAALSGAMRLALDPQAPECCRKTVAQTEVINLAQHPAFPRTFAICMRFDTEG